MSYPSRFRCLEIAPFGVHRRVDTLPWPAYDSIHLRPASTANRHSSLLFGPMAARPRGSHQQANDMASAWNAADVLSAAGAADPLHLPHRLWLAFSGTILM